MNFAQLNKIVIFVVPTTLLFVAYLTLPIIGSLPPSWKMVASYLPFTAIAIGALLSLQFNRGRAFLGFIILALFYRSCINSLSVGASGFWWGIIFQALLILIPFNITLLSFMRERGVLTTPGRIRLLFLAIQAMVIALLIRLNYIGLEDLLSSKSLEFSFWEPTTFSILVLLFFCTGFSCVFLRTILTQSYTNSAFLSVIAAVGLVYALKVESAVSIVFITAVALSLILAVLQETKTMAYYDELTDLPSRRALNEKLMDLGTQYVIAMADVDHFKKFNDTYGHDVGDQVLQIVANKIKKVKGGGKSFRYGGEEFTVIFKGKTLEYSLIYIESLRKEISDYKFKPAKSNELKEDDRLAENRDDAKVSVTVSFGVAVSKEGCTPAEILQNADEAVYRAKQKGRNQVSL